MALNLNVYKGVTPELLKDTIKDWKKYVKSDDEVDGVRITIEEHQKYLTPVLLSSNIVIDERKSDEV
jgi:hypothetical protein